MYLSDGTHVLQLSSKLSPEEVSQAWAFLASLPPPSPFLSPPLPQPPENLQHLSNSDWYLLDKLLEQTLEARSQESLH